MGTLSSPYPQAFVEFVSRSGSVPSRVGGNISGKTYRSFVIIGQCEEVSEWSD